MRNTRAMKIVAIGSVLTALLAGCASAGAPSDATASPSAIPGAAPQTQVVAPPYTVNVNDLAGESGYVFLTTGVNEGAAAAAADNPGGTPNSRSRARAGSTVIVDKAGRAVWLGQLPTGQTANNFQVQTYQGQPVLTWTQCTKEPKDCSYLIANTHYQVIATVTVGDGYTPDTHEFRLTPDGHALVIADKEVPYDLTPVGGSKDGTVQNTVALEIDVATNKVVAQWDPLAHVPITDSYLTPGGPGRNGSFDAFHMNSISLAPDGDWVISLRSASAVYDVDPKTGAINWQLGGKNPTLSADPGVQFAFQHDAEFDGPDTIRLFDNDNSMTATANTSSIEWIHIDPTAKTASLVRSQTHPDGLTVWATGNAQALPNGNTFGSWGTAGHISEFSPTGQMVYDVVLPGATTYRAFLEPWVGQPRQAPELVVTSDGAPAVHAIWNGATEVRHWRLLSGESADALNPIAEADWNGLNTAIPLPANTPTTGYFQVVALDADGNTIGQSVITKG